MAGRLACQSRICTSRFVKGQLSEDDPSMENSEAYLFPKVTIRYEHSCDKISIIITVAHPASSLDK
jgi:hypothetical protein